VVEDNTRLRQATARQLEALGYRVREAEHAVAALAILAGEDRVDLLFSDVVMPGTIDGIGSTCGYRPDRVPESATFPTSFE